jgi:hypothetical protein
MPDQGPRRHFFGGACGLTRGSGKNGFQLRRNVRGINTRGLACLFEWHTSTAAKVDLELLKNTCG